MEETTEGLLRGDRRLLKHPWRTIAAACSMAFVAFALQAGGVRTAVAKADYCNATGGGYSCFWGQENLANETRRYFTAEVTLRNWVDEEVADGYGGTVAAKCANIMATNGAVAQVACGSGQPFGWVPAAYDPGYVFIVQGSAGPRTILGAALQ
jgi:hypothetical protein